MPAAEALSIIEEQDVRLSALPFHCRTYCPRVKHINAMLWAATRRSLEAVEGSEEQINATHQAKAALGALSSLQEPASTRCMDGPYYTTPGFMPTEGEEACKLNLIEQEYYLSRGE